MGILKKTVTAARESTSLHFPNETEMTPEDSDVQVTNNYMPDTLIDPEDAEGGDTHFTNEKEYSDKTNKIHADAHKDPKGVSSKAPKHPEVVPLAKEKGPHHPAKTKAGVAEDDAEGLDDPTFPPPNANATFPAGGPDSGTEKVAAKRRLKADSEQETGQQDTQHVSNFDNPTDTPEPGYLEVREEGLQAGRGASAPVQANDGLEPELPHGNAPQQALQVEEVADIDEFEDDDFVAEPEVSEEIEEAVGPGEEEMSILDVDGADDEADDVVFANIGSSVKVIKANRIIASMSKQVAARAGHEDMYMSEQFAQVTEVEMAKHGVRAGLKKMGFVLASVNLGKAEVLNKRVEMKANKLTANVRAEAEAQFEVLEQALAIAAVGINKGFFKEQRNELRAALETELEAAGVRGHKKMLASVFATKGIDFAKAILTVAKRVALMGEETRANFVKALDMVGDDLNDDDDLFGNSAAPDFQSQFATEESPEEADEFADEVADEGSAPQTIHAALVRPASNIRRSNEVSAKSTGYSVSAAAILSGKAPLPFA